MGIDLDLRWSKESVRLDDVCSRISRRLAAHFPTVSPLRCDSGAAVLGSPPWQISFGVGPEGALCTCYRVPSAAGLEEAETGAWLCVSAGSRTLESMLWMLLVAASIGDLIQEDIVDEAEILGLGRTVSPSSCLALLDRFERADIADAARLLFEKPPIKDGDRE